MEFVRFRSGELGIYRSDRKNMIPWNWLKVLRRNWEGLEPRQRRFLAMLQIDVALASGQSERFEVSQDTTIAELKSLAQRTFRQGLLKLVTAKGEVLANPMQLVQDAGLQDGDNLTAFVLKVMLAATDQAFALWCCGGDKVVTWGNANFGGDISQVKDQLKSVQQIQATKKAFAAILEDGTVVTWGGAENGGDSSAVQDQLCGVQQIQATEYAFAAILADGSVVTWGDAEDGGDSSAVQDQLRMV